MVYQVVRLKKSYRQAALVLNDIYHVDEDFWNAKIYSKLIDFYMRHMLPEMACPRHLSGPVHEYIPFDYSGDISGDENSNVPEMLDPLQKGEPVPKLILQ